MTAAPPEARTGVYTQPSDIPAHHRLTNRATRADYDGRDVWADYWSGDGPSSNRQQGAMDCWNTFLAARDTHHALAEPEDAAAYAAYLLDEREYAPTTVKNYWGAVHRFYDWLMWHTDHPHLYNSLLVAAAADETARQAFDYYVIPYTDL